jgi:hypothetical protein
VWEYTFVKYSSRGGDTNALMAEITALGAQGWELTSVVVISEELLHLILKREAANKPTPQEKL